MAPGERCAAAGVASFVYANYYAPDWARIETAADLESIEDHTAGVWFLYSLPLHLEAYHPGVHERVLASYQLERVFPGTLGDGAVYVYHWRKGATP
jgi:hypothetical protein